MNLIPGKVKPSAGLPALAYSPRKLSKQPEPSQSIALVFRVGVNRH
jgi:hypothetical protein